MQVFLVTSANAFAFTTSSLTNDSSQEGYYYAHVNKQAVLFDENISGFEVEISSEKENDLHSYIPGHYFKSRFDYLYSVNNYFSEYQPNKKKILKKQIFPFHFFW